DPGELERFRSHRHHVRPAARLHGHSHRRAAPGRRHAGSLAPSAARTSIRPARDGARTRAGAVMAPVTGRANDSVVSAPGRTAPAASKMSLSTNWSTIGGGRRTPAKT